MRSACKYRHQHSCRVIFVVTVLLAAANDVRAVDMTTVRPASVPSKRNLTLVLMTPRDGTLGFERNAAASTLALRQAQADGLLSDMPIR